MTDRFIESCEQEQLHLSGHIQAFGALLMVDHESCVRHVSANFSALAITEQTPKVGERVCAPIDALLRNYQSTSCTSLFGFSGVNEAFSVWVTPQPTGILLEFAKAAEGSVVTITEPEFPAFRDEDERNFYRHQLLEWVAHVTGHQRVMYYQFLEEGDGQVVDEYVASDVQGSYLDLHFPASDIPKVARRIYEKTPWRQIADATSEAVPIKGESHLDLTLSCLRSVSPYHLQYMSNMGVESSVSFSIVSQNNLTALLSCQSMTPRTLSLELLNYISSIVDMFSLRERGWESQARFAFLDTLNLGSAALKSLLGQPQLNDGLWSEIINVLMQQFEADGVVICTDEMLYSHGISFESDILQLVDGWFVEQEESIFATDSLLRLTDEPLLSQVAGFCAFKVRLGQVNHLRVYCCRQEFIHHVSWGGNPNKPKETTGAGVPTSPRSSFARWVEKRLGHSRPWSSLVALRLHHYRKLFEESRFIRSL